MKMRSERIALDKIYKRRDRYEIPDWQREEVWSTSKKQKLIDSILRGWKLPKFYFLLTGTSPNEYDVLDGQQRLSAIWEFFDDDLKLSSDTARDFRATSYTTLPDEISDAFDDYEITFDVIEDADEPEQKEFFQRLQEGLPLTSSEKLNSVHSKLRDYCATIAKHKFFSETAVASGKRYGHFDICAKVTAIEIEGLDCGTRFEDIKEVFLQQSGFSGRSAVAKRVRKALSILHNELPRPDKQLRNRTLVQSVITFTCYLLSVGLEKGQHESLAAFIEHFLKELSKQVELGQDSTDNDYVAFQRTVNANVKSGPKARNDIMLRKLLQFSPSFYSSIPQSNDLARSVKADVGRAAESIRRLIIQANDVYAASNGKDLFKPTNKTIGAMTSKITDPIIGCAEYNAFVEQLYFVFWESTGSRLDGQIPDAFRDVNRLRTLNEHDVDHGKASRVSKKRKGLAATFEKYSGEKTPSTADPSKFPVIQLNVLSALERDLRQLVKQLQET